MLPTVDDTIMHFEGGPSVAVRHARYAYGRVETWVSPHHGPLEAGCRCRLPDGTLTLWEGGAAQRLPLLLLASVRYENGLWDSVDVTDAVLEMDASDLASMRDGDVRPPFVPGSAAEVEICGAISHYLGEMPDFDAIGMVVSRRIDDARLDQARRLRYSSIWMNSPGAGMG